MKITLATAAALALVATLASTALAQPSQPPPHGGDGSDLSHINGQLVKVGEHNEYYYGIRRTMVSSNPLGWMFGFYGVSVSHAFGNNIAVRVDANLYDNVMGSDVGGYELGVGLPLYLRRAYQGVFLEPGFIVREIGSDYEGGGEREMGPQVLLGYGWVWDSGFSVQAAVGGGRNLESRDRDEYEGDTSEPFFNGYFRMGYAF